MTAIRIVCICSWRRPLRWPIGAGRGFWSVNSAMVERYRAHLERRDTEAAQMPPAGVIQKNYRKDSKHSLDQWPSAKRTASVVPLAMSLHTEHFACDNP